MLMMLAAAANPIQSNHLCCFGQVVAALLAEGADPNAADNGGNSALSLALLSLPSLPSLPLPPSASFVGKLAASASRLDRIHAIAVLLLRASAARGFSSPLSSSPSSGTGGGGGGGGGHPQALLLHKVAHSGRADVLQFLLAVQTTARSSDSGGGAAAADLANSLAPDNMTPLHYAAQESHVDVRCCSC